MSIPARAATDNLAICNRGALERLGAYAEEGLAGQKDEKAAIAFYKKAADLGSDEAADALQRLRCKFTLKDKDGKPVGIVCYIGD
ncbi:TPR repeat protein [Nitrobacteraceae bacterium AZCC 1564]